MAKVSLKYIKSLCDVEKVKKVEKVLQLSSIQVETFVLYRDKKRKLFILPWLVVIRGKNIYWIKEFSFFYFIFFPGWGNKSEYTLLTILLISVVDFHNREMLIHVADLSRSLSKSTLCIKCM